jgi:hypothetical protein
MVQVLGRRLRVQRDHGVLQLLGPDRLGERAGDEDQRLAHGEVAAPYLEAQVVRRGQALAVELLGKGEEPRLANEERMRRAQARHVQLVAADDAHGQPDRAALEALTLALVAEAAVYATDGLLEDDRDARRFVVVVVAPDRLRDQRGRLAHTAAGTRRHRRDDVEIPLGPAPRPDGRLRHQHGVGRAPDPVALGHEPDLEMKTGGHRAGV